MTALVLAAPEKGSAKVAVTTQAPHPAWLHMALVPVSLSVSRRKLSRLVEADSAAVSTVVAWPLTSRVTGASTRKMSRPDEAAVASAGR